MNIEKIELESKLTIGYSESENKLEFIKGVNVAFSKMEEYVEKEVENLKMQVDMYKTRCEKMQNEFKAVASIISRYSDN